MQNTGIAVSKSRLAIYFFFDSQGVVDDYVPHMLQALRAHVDRLVVIVNGVLQPEGRRVLLAITSDLLVRSNEGFDVQAYREGLSLVGWEEAATYDEVIFLNSTFFGPLYPLKEMFDAMDTREVDFWGITKHTKLDFDPYGKISCGYLPEHIQSHFIAVRRNLLQSAPFRAHWDSMPPITSYEDSVCYHEAIFTKKFADLGYRWSVYVDTADIDEYTDYPLMIMTRELIEKRRCPILKRRSFFQHYSFFLSNTCGEQTVETMDFIRGHLDYDVGLIYQNILRTCNMAQIKRCLHTNYILPKAFASRPRQGSATPRVALIMHLYFEELFPYCLQYARSMPAYADVYLTTTSEKKRRKLLEVFGDLPCAHLEVRVTENRGRSESAFLVGCKDIVAQYDYICFMHDKKVGHIKPLIKGMSFSNRCYENLLASPAFVENILHTFEDNPYLGMLMPPPPNHADFYPTIGNEWVYNFDITTELARKLKIEVPMSPDLEPITPLGGMFWFRPAALKTLFDHNWQYSEFPQEPTPPNQTLLHAIERIYGFTIQHEGFYPAWVFSDEYARVEVTNLHYMLRELNVALFPRMGLNNHFGLVNTIRARLIFRITCLVRIKNMLRRILPGFILQVLRRLRRR